METQLTITFTDEQVFEHVELIKRIGNRTIKESIKLGEMLTSKKKEKGHGEWLPFLEWISLPQTTAKNLMKAYREKNNLLEGMTFSQLIGNGKSPVSGDMKKPATKKEPIPLNEGLEKIANLCKKKIEKDYGLLHWNEFLTIINNI